MDFNNKMIMCYGFIPGNQRAYKVYFPIAYTIAVSVVVSGSSVDYSANTHNVQAADYYYGTLREVTTTSFTYGASACRFIALGF